MRWPWQVWRERRAAERRRCIELAALSLPELQEQYNALYAKYFDRVSGYAVRFYGLKEGV